MPKIPQYESKAQFTTDVNAGRVSPETMTQDIRAMKGTAGAITDLGMKMVQVQDEQETNAAQSMLLEDTYATREKATAESDLSKLGQYEDEINKSVSKSAGLIKGTAARNSFIASAQKSAIATKYAIRDNFQDKRIKQAQADLIAHQSVARDKLRGATEPEKMAIIGNVRAAIYNAANAGFLDKVSAQISWDKFKQDVTKAEVMNDLYSDPKQAQAELEKGKNGKYALMDESERSEMAIQAKNYVKKAENEMIWAQEKKYRTNENSLTTAFVNNNLTELQVRNALANDDVTPDYANTMIKTLASPKTVDAQTKAEVYLNIQQEWSKLEEKGNKATFAEIAAIRNDAVAQYGAGALNFSDMKDILDNSQEAFDKRFKGTVDQITSGEDYKKKHKKSFYENISFWSDEYAADKIEIKARMIRNFNDLVKAGTDPDLALKKTIDLEKIKSTYTVGQVVTTPGGRVEVISFDQDGEPIVRPVK